MSNIFDYLLCGTYALRVQSAITGQWCDSRKAAVKACLEYADSLCWDVQPADAGVLPQNRSPYQNWAPKEEALDEVISLSLYMLVSPIILIPCLFVGTADLRFPYVLLLGWLCSSIGGILSFPVIRFFVVSWPIPSGNNTFTSAIIAGVIAGTIITCGMYMFSRRKGADASPKSNDNDRT